MESAQFVKEIGLQENTIYNSIYKGVQEVELAKIKELGIKTFIVLADNPKDGSFQGKMTVLDEALDMAKRAGIEQVMIDCAIPAFAPDMGITVRAIPAIKEKFGWPTGLGTGNVVTTMGWVKAHVAKEYRKGCVTATNASCRHGRKLAHVRPSRTSRIRLPRQSQSFDTYIASAAADLDTRPLSEDHPISKCSCKQPSLFIFFNFKKDLARATAQMAHNYLVYAALTSLCAFVVPSDSAFGIVRIVLAFTYVAFCLVTVSSIVFR
jgi:tetrahydromethanopterin S-methyltransferase subunit H